MSRPQLLACRSWRSPRWCWRCWQFFATVPVFGKMLLPPFFFSTPIDVAGEIFDLVLERHDLEAPRRSPC